MTTETLKNTAFAVSNAIAIGDGATATQDFQLAIKTFGLEGSTQMTVDEWLVISNVLRRINFKETPVVVQ